MLSSRASLLIRRCADSSSYPRESPLRYAKIRQNTRRMRLTRFGSAIFVLAAAAASPSLAQNYPAKNIRVINAYAPGGASDVVARAFAQKLTEYMGQQVTVENRVGAGGNIASEYVARSAPDGYTI